MKDGPTAWPPGAPATAWPEAWRGEGWLPMLALLGAGLLVYVGTWSWLVASSKRRRQRYGSGSSLAAGGAVTYPLRGGAGTQGAAAAAAARPAAAAALEKGAAASTAQSFSSRGRSIAVAPTDPATLPPPGAPAAAAAAACVVESSLSPSAPSSVHLGKEPSSSSQGHPPLPAAAAAAPAAAAASATAEACAAAAGVVPPKGPVPRHIAVIMDGNRRYGREEFADPLKGHEEGGRTLSNFTRWCMERDVEMLTVYAFSTENWRRDPREVGALMRIFCEHAETMKREALAWGVRVRVLCSDPDRLPAHVAASLGDLEAATRGGARFTLNLCVSYGARGEIANACRRIAAEVAAGALAVEEVDEAAVAGRLLTAGLPDPDLLIRTSGECRVSNFLLFQLAYAEMVFLDKFWPQVTAHDLDAILADFARRHRRYGS